MPLYSFWGIVMKYRVIKPHTASYTEVITARAGDRLAFERRPSEWPGWIWCIAPDGKTGWVPESWVEIEGNACRLRSDYSTAELTVNAGEIVEGDIIESGWAWVKNQNGEWGWVPMVCLELV
jgi:hypothetical protein